MNFCFEHYFVWYQDKDVGGGQREGVKKEKLEMCKNTKAYKAYTSLTSYKCICFVGFFVCLFLWNIRCMKENEECREWFVTWIMNAVVYHTKDFKVYYFIMWWWQGKKGNDVKYFKWRNQDLIRFHSLKKIPNWNVDNRSGSQEVV